MNIVSFLIIVIIFIGFVAAVRFYIKNGGPTKCGNGCDGDCGTCAEHVK